MTKHTPGPWLVEGRTVYALNDDGYNRFSALVQDAHTPGDELEANARLIAAAPDLLVGLIKMLDNEEQRVFEKWLQKNTPSGDVSSVQSQWLDSSEYEDFLETWALQIAAIAKARGEA